MKKISFLLICFSVVTIWSGCVKDRITGVPANITYLGNVRKLYTDKPITIKSEDLQGATSIMGTVISDVDGGNVPDGFVIIQSVRGTMVRGLALNLGADASKYFKGDLLEVNVNGKTLNRINGVLQVTGLTSADVMLKAVNQAITPSVATSTVTTITNNMDQYECTLVKLSGAVADAADVGKTFEGDRTITDWASPIVFHTKASANFASTLIPDMGNYTGIAFYHSVSGNVQPTIWLRNADDIEKLNLQPRLPGQLYQNFPEGWEDRTTSHISAYNANGKDVFPSGEWLFPRMYTISSSTLTYKIGTWAILMQAGFTVGATMNFNLPYGASKLSFYCGPATASDTNLPNKFVVEYSQDSGVTWQQIDLITFTTFKQYYQEYNLDIKGPVRFRFTQMSGDYGVGNRCFLDQIAVYQN